MKMKTSISISKRVLEAVKRVAKRDERSVSYVIEKFIEEKAMELPDEPRRTYSRQKVRYSRSTKKRSSGRATIFKKK
jgi:predicted CopG family antitoxin